MRLAGHGAEAADLPEHPLQHAVLAGGVGGQELAGLLGEVLQDRAGFEDGEAIGRIHRWPGILLLGLIARNSGVNWSPLLMFTGMTR